MKVGLLTYYKAPDLTISDRKLIPLLSLYGIEAEPVIWNSFEIDWSNYNALIFRSTWDYYLLPDIFTEWLHKIESLGLKIYNPYQVIINNMHKFYLRNMEQDGFRIIPSVFVPSSSDFDLASLLPATWEDFVIKPAVSAGSFLTTLCNINQINDIIKSYAPVSAVKDLIIQKFMPEIQTIGEVSLVFFNKKFSHAVLKRPKEGDFRIQSQFGGKYETFIPDNYLIKTTQSIVNYISEDLLFARVDGVLVNGEFYLMELELIEPDLYLELTDNGTDRFVYEIARQFRLT